LHRSCSFSSVVSSFSNEKEERMQSKHKRKLATSIGMMYIAFGNHSFVHSHNIYATLISQIALSN
ncbi:hypothetical protein T01_15900, partial [Trichinella spiralis]